jgi:hypothetical protein
METSLEQLDIGEHLLILGNGNVVRDVLQVGFDHASQLRRRRRLREGGRHCQQLVDGGGHGLAVRGPLAVGTYIRLVSVDTISQAIEVLADARICATRRRLDEHVDGVIERLPGCLHVAGLEIVLAGLEVLIGERDQGGDGIFDRSLG